MTSTVNRIRRTDVQRCEATTKGQWYAEPHQCPYAAITNLDGERYTCLVDCGLPAELCACYLEECELNRVDKADAWDAIVEKNREITRLRAALADAQAVGFAAGVEAAAKAGSDAAIQVALRQNPELSPLRQQLIKQAIANPIRALVCPELTAAAARVLLEDDAAMNTLSDYEHRQWAGWFKHQLEQSTPENIERWKRQADMPFTLLSDDEKAADRRFADAALRAIAGDTP